MIEAMEPLARRERFRSAIAAFIEARREAKLKGQDEDVETQAKYGYATWLADAARRVSQIQAVTHVLKATHPDARGSSLHVTPMSLPQRIEIGTHLLGEAFTDDVVGNAAALDVFKLLKVEVDDKRLLEWMQVNDADLLAALSSDVGMAQEWMSAFASLVRQEQQPASHPLAKQIYWLTGEDSCEDKQYQLLQPLFSSSLAQVVHADIQDARFGEDNKLARQAFRSRAAHPTPYHDYRNLVARKLGGTKPQNISQLNSERGGVNYLLASLPPLWAGDKTQGLLRLASVFDRFRAFDGVQPLLKALADFLRADPPNTMETRNKREALEQALAAQLPVFAASIQARMAPGWSRDPECQLPRCQQLWLDAERLELPPCPGYEQMDDDFRADYHRGDWPDEVAGMFGNWVNARLRDAGLTAVGDAEYQHWAKQVILDVAWPAPMQRRAPTGDKA